MFVNSLPLAVMVVGSMGTGKTTLMTYLALIQETIYRKKTLELLISTSLTFPDFPWIEFENDLKESIAQHSIYSLATTRAYIRAKANLWAECPSFLRLWGYNAEKYGLTYNDGINELHLFDILEDYAQLYFIYTIQSSLIVANYGVRSDNIMKYKGNFPLWDTDFFSRLPQERAVYSNNSHILDFDMLRLGLKVLENNELVGALEFGVIVISEGAKERGNQNDTKEMKQNVSVANQKNDLFNLRLKLARHTATVKYIPFVKYLLDDQRPDSLNADCRELFTLVNISEVGGQELALRGFFLEELLHDWIYPRFERRFKDERYRRGDNTLTFHLWKTFVSALHNHYVRTYNQYGYKKVFLELEAGTRDGKVVAHPFYINNAVIYADRYSTDCFKDIFDRQSLNCAYGLEDIPPYQTTTASMDELNEQHSFFIDSLNKHL